MNPRPTFRPRWWPAALVWAGGWLVMLGTDPWLDLAHQALLLVLVSALSALWLTTSAALLTCALAIIVFDLTLVTPRGNLAVALPLDALLLATMLAVSAMVTLLMSRQRRLAEEQRQLTQRAEQLRTLGERLREVDEPLELAEQLQQALECVTGSTATLVIQDRAPIGTASVHELEGLQVCQREGAIMGPGTGRYEDQPAWYFPMRGRRNRMGAVLVRLNQSSPRDAATREHAQALCDQMGIALERAVALRSEAAAREAAQAQALRNTLLAAIAHDHRTPLATILGAASSLHDQSDRLGPLQRRQLAATIIDEADQLTRLTDNTLQLARLDRPGASLHLDWESAEEIVGTVMRRLRQRHGAIGVRLRIEPNLPLIRCDAVLIAQLLDNLIDNALKYAGAAHELEIIARRSANRLILAVADRGPGVPPVLREVVFGAFRRGAQTPPPGEDSMPRGAGIGLAVCRAIAHAHGGEMRCRARRGGGAAFELWLPLAELPDMPLPAERPPKSAPPAEPAPT